MLTLESETVFSTHRVGQISRGECHKLLQQLIKCYFGRLNVKMKANKNNVG
jgi:hypothetical protein